MKGNHSWLGLYGGHIPNPHQTQRGFTLVELLVVLVILVFLAAIVAPSLFKSMDSAKSEMSDVKLVSISNALEQFKFDIGRFPTSSEGLKALLKKPPGLRDWNGPYIRAARDLTSPSGKPYNYRSSGLSGKFELGPPEAER